MGWNSNPRYVVRCNTRIWKMRSVERLRVTLFGRPRTPGRWRLDYQCVVPAPRRAAPLLRDRFMPEKSEELWKSLGAPGSPGDTRFNGLERLDPAGWKVVKGPPLFPKKDSRPE